MYRKDLIKPDGRKLFLYSLKEINSPIEATTPLHHPTTPNPQMRWHPLRGEWVVYAAHRQNRTFLPPKEYSPLAVTTNKEFPTELPAGDYNVAVFENLFPSFSEKAHKNSESIVPTDAASGACEVVVFTQNPDMSLGQMSLDEIKLVLQVIAERTKELGKRKDIQYVLPFENRGVEVGVTLHHPHGQIYAYPFIPPVPARMLENKKNFFLKNKKTLLQNLVHDELKDGKRMIVSHGATHAFVPAFARYPYETWIVTERPSPWFYSMSDAEISQMAKTLKHVLMKYDKMWQRPFPYLMAFYQAPTDGEAHDEFHSHIQICPAYRTRDKLKFLAGTELGAGIFVNDSLPEEKAAELRAVEIELDSK